MSTNECKGQSSAPRPLRLTYSLPSSLCRRGRSNGKRTSVEVVQRNRSSLLADLGGEAEGDFSLSQHSSINMINVGHVHTQSNSVFEKMLDICIILCCLAEFASGIVIGKLTTSYLLNNHEKSLEAFIVSSVIFCLLVLRVWLRRQEDETAVMLFDCFLFGILGGAIAALLQQDVESASEENSEIVFEDL